jgi:hypothetical protein
VVITITKDAKIKWKQECDEVGSSFLLSIWYS